VFQVVENLPSKHEALSSNTSNTKKKRKNIYLQLSYDAGKPFIGTYPKGLEYWG
jgi:hypothetical protein